MQKIDILRAIYDKKITAKEADDILGKLLESDIPNILDLVGIELKKEWTALSFHHMPYETVAQWRYEGWPNKCALCKNSIAVEDGGWRPLEELRINNKIHKNVLTHWDCYSSITKKHKNLP